MNKLTKLVSSIIMVVIVFSLAACSGGNSINGTWVPKEDSQTVGFTEIALKGSEVKFAGVPSTPGARYVYKISNDKMVISAKVTGVPEMEFMSFDYKKNGSSIFLNDMEYVKK